MSAFGTNVKMRGNVATCSKNHMCTFKNVGRQRSNVKC